MHQITGTIITLNEEDHIGAAVASMSVCDEIIVVDSGSLDRTCIIARQLGARVIERPWEGYSKQKNFAASQARHDWILSVDADEQLSAELAAEIAQWKSNSDSRSAMSMPRRASYMGRWIRHSGWYPDWKIRLYDRRRASWKGDFVHEALVVDGEVGRFTNDLLHNPYRAWADHYNRIDRYTQLAAEAARKSGRRANPLKLVFGPPLFFIKTLFIQAGILDGWRGIAIAYMGARYVFLREFRILR
jgi:glycosyltransferase involved in cell wall biosynthesis